jgi:hypothetical protein
MGPYLATVVAFGGGLLPAGGALTAILVRRAARSLERLRTDDAQSAEAVEARRRLLMLPRYMSRISFALWVLAIPFFLGFLSLLNAPAPRDFSVHIAVFSLLCAVIGATYTEIFPSHVALRLIFAWTTVDARDLGAALNLAVLPRRLRVLQIITAVNLPLSGVIAMAFWPDPMGTGVRVMLSLLLCLGTMGAIGALYSAAEAVHCAEALQRLQARVANLALPGR